MNPHLHGRGALRLVLAPTLILLLACTTALSGERLPVRTFTSADGLGSSFVSSVIQDSLGYVWLTTRDGLSRWNGYEFSTVAQGGGFPDPALDRVFQMRSGEYFVIDNAGALYSFLPTAATGPGAGKVTFRRRQHRLDGNDIRFTRLLEDRHGVLWAGGHGVLVKALGGAEQLIRLRHPSLSADALLVVDALADDAYGTLWIGTNRGLLRLMPDGTLHHLPLSPRDGADVVNALATDGAGRLWIGHSWLGVVVLVPGAPAPKEPSTPLVLRPLEGDALLVSPAPGEAALLTTASGLPSNTVSALLATSDGQMWVGTADGLARYDGTSFSTYTRDNGLCDNLIHGLAEDGDGNIWVATPTGAMRMARDGFSGYTSAEGLGADHVTYIGEMPNGHVYAVGIDWSVNVFDGRQFRMARLPVPKGSSLMWLSQVGYHDRTGHWWALTGQGLYRYSPGVAEPPLPTGAPDRAYIAGDGLPSSKVFRVYQDRAGALWVGTRSGDPRDDGLVRFDAGLGRATTFGPEHGLPRRAPAAFAEDGRGNLWVGFYQGGIARYRDGRFRPFTEEDGVPRGGVTALLADRAGRLWVATNLAGVVRIDDPTTDRLTVRAYTTRDGLASNNVRALTEDSSGRIFVGSARGVDRLDPATGHVEHYGIEDGLLGDFVTAAFCDSRGQLWFGTYRGVSRLAPAPEREAQPPPVLITAVTIAGQAYPVSELGRTSLSGLELESDQRDIAVEFVGVSRHRFRGVAYQYSTDGGATWSVASASRSVNFARLPPGAYTLAVRAITASGTTSAAASTISFSIAPPLWRRWWVVSLAVAALSAALAAGYRYRVRRLLEMERLRMRIASDLHDEVATNLSSIAMFSALVKGDDGRESPFLDRISALSAESLEAIREIIWSIDPKPESIADLVERLRDGMITSCRARGMQLTVLVPGDSVRQNLTPEQRKNLWLMLKEAVTNAVKHSGASAVSVIVTPSGRQVRIVVKDNGSGAGSATDSSGRGLSTMRARAESLGGTFSLSSESDAGTTVEFVVPLGTYPSTRRH
jgi:ligand-binding sensor domain-containing protein/signal transduction histidine kinase